MNVATSQVVLQEAVDLDGSRIIHSVSREKAESLPAWNPEAEAPPLSIAAAVDLAKAAALGRHPDCEGFKVVTIHLFSTPSCHPWVPVKWFYLLRLVPLVDWDDDHVGTVLEVVLMDGTVVPPRREGKADNA